MKKRNKTKKHVVLSVLPLRVTVAVCFRQSLCFVLPLRICIYTSTFSEIYIFYLIYNTELFICYVHINL